MMIIGLIWALLLLVVMIMMSLSILINKKTFMDREKSSPFECGFDPQNSSRMPLSMRFFIITLIFLIFDVEITLLLPLVYMPISFTSGVSISLFIVILLVGVFYEWKEGALSWVN
uniref:NADH-ubiquinone oxidoreductase chain 3 n=1 Tax=Phallocryptus tserensodnomi TaxID=1383053 RepID=A0A0U1Z7B6_9CRUS|nr:NADH dehydrogenase subunit 3 [Phallocryptus tserensodnomi]AJP76845.1 NADH dehydrogenase subunit 3 [Phallocryptus tserensodnomi]